MVLTLARAAGPLCGSVEMPGDKSLAHRAALFAALAEGESEVSNYPDSGVTRAMRGALRSLGVDSSLDKEAVRIVKMSPKWTPGKQRERPVKVVYNFPVVFQLR